MNKRGLVFFLLIFIALNGHAQKCDITIEGYVFDEASSSPLAYVNVFIQETQIGTITDEEGNFVLGDICEGSYHFILSHVGCEDEKFHIDITQDTILKIGLNHTPTSLGTIVVSGKKENTTNQANLTVKRKTIVDNSNQNLSGLLENETGVHLIKNGNGIAKPVVHGLYGNRLILLNNGIAQSGQQWGNDHSPEIDPFSSDRITVIKGASVIEYGGGNLGSVILTEPKRIEREPHLHGQVNYILESNGIGQTLNGRLEKFTPTLAWRINGTYKRYGDKKTPDYYLNNTGLEEGNFSIQLEKSINDKWFLDFYGSTFNTRLGILRGSHIGNLTDLEQALSRDVPFFTEPDFSLKLEAPFQDVSHHFIKSKVKYFIDDNQNVALVLAGQLNNRKEFDVRRSGRTEIPSLSLNQLTVNAEFKYVNNFSQNWKLSIGNQTIVTDNTNNPETGISPLIPDYLSWKNGLFTTLSRNAKRFFLNIGLRYDYEDQTVLTFSNTVPIELIRYDKQFHSISSLVSLKSNISKTQSIAWNIGYAQRNPAINERYSFGLHQGVSGIEEGDPNIKTEKALKNTVEYKWVPNSDFALNVLAYHQRFNDYVYLEPQDEVRLTIRGAFPVFKYTQTDANIYGLDVSTQFTIKHALLGTVKYSYLRGDDTKNDQPLIFMPPNSLYSSLTYRLSQSLKFTKNLNIEDTEIEIFNRWVFEQKHILANQDFKAPPPSYNLFGLKFSGNINLPKYKIRTFVKADNLFNVSYRDYLNRHRYFADDNGFSLTAGVNIKF